MQRQRTHELHVERAQPELAVCRFANRGQGRNQARFRRPSAAPELIAELAQALLEVV